jgi:hypothetical protein
VTVVPAREIEALLNAHSYLGAIERPPQLWDVDVELEPLVRVMGEMLAAALARNGGELGEVVLNVSNVVVEGDSAGPMPAGELVALTVRTGGGWSDSVWPASGMLLSGDLSAAAERAGAVYGYSRALGSDAGSVTVLFKRG